MVGARGREGEVMLVYLSAILNICASLVADRATTIAQRDRIDAHNRHATLHTNVSKHNITAQGHLHSKIIPTTLLVVKFQGQDQFFGQPTVDNHNSNHKSRVCGAYFVGFFFEAPSLFYRSRVHGLFC